MENNIVRLKKTNIFLVTLAIIITIINHIVNPFLLKIQPDTLGTGLSFIFLASAFLNHLRSN